jgi:hypothetical protein
VEPRERFDIYVSPIVVQEVRAGDPAIARLRLDLISDLPRVDIVPQVVRLARKLHDYLNLPQKARLDVYHLALACHWNMDYLLTWNMRHLANAQVRLKLARYQDATGISVPVICTPEELFDEEDEP